MPHDKKRFVTLALAAACGVAAVSAPAVSWAEDWSQWGRTPSKNMVSTEKGGPLKWDAKGVAEGEKGEGIRWSALLGSQSYGNPVVANGMVYVGSNNEAAYDKGYNKDAG